MFFINLQKYVYSKKCSKQRSQPAPHSSKNRRYFRAKKVTWLQLLFAIEYAYCDPADRVTKRSIYRSP